MKRTAQKIGYIGTNFHGFQRQPNLRTVEEELIYHLRKLDYIDDLKKITGKGLYDYYKRVFA